MAIIVSEHLMNTALEICLACECGAESLGFMKGGECLD